MGCLGDATALTALALGFGAAGRRTKGALTDMAGFCTVERAATGSDDQIDAGFFTGLT